MEDISFLELHLMGGSIFMFPLSLLFLANISITLFVIFSMIKKTKINTNWIESIKHIGLLAAVWGTFSTIEGLFQAFDAIEASAEEIPLQIICGGLKVALITVLYGLIIFCISLLDYIILKLVARPSVS